MEWSGCSLAVGQTWSQAFALPFTSEVAVDRPSKPSKPHFPLLLLLLIHKIVVILSHDDPVHMNHCQRV